MTEIVTVETTCDNCGTAIGGFDSRWVASLDERHDPNAPVNAMWYTPAKALHICIECAQSVLGELIRNAASRSRS